MKIKTKFSISKHEATRRIKNLLPKIKEEFKDKITNVTEKWESEDKANFSFNIMGFNIKGDFQVTDTEAIIDVDLPFALFPFKGMIETKITEEAKKLLS